MAQIHTFKEAHAALRQFYGPTTGEKRYTLDRIRRLMDFLDNPQNDLKVIHIAGTSGKTSTAYYAAALLHQAGSKVGLTVSPHVDEINERIQINLVPLAEEKFCQALGQFLERISQSSIRPSYFELMIAFAFYEFKRQNVDYAVVEVGLGGLLDGTNVVMRADKVCIITDIGLDHTEVLGGSLAAIASQKAGIIKPHNHVFIHPQSSEVMNTVRQVVALQAAALHKISRPSPPETKILPIFQRRNYSLALAAISYVLQRDGYPAVSPAQRQVAAATYIPARMEIVTYHGQTIILDGAHNAQKLEQLLVSLKSRFGDQPLVVLLGFVDGLATRWQQALDVLLGEASELILTSFDAEPGVPKAGVAPGVLRAYCQRKQFTHLSIAANPAAGFSQLLDHPASLKLVVGSFYLLNHIRPLLAK